MNPTAFEIFSWGIDYGQLLSEQERDQEDLFDAFQGMIIDNKFSMPAKQTERRQPRSEEWRKAKLDSLNKFIEYQIQLKTKGPIQLKSTL